MTKSDIPENGASVRFLRTDEEEWRDGEFDGENHLFIEVYALEPSTHNMEDIREWEYLQDMG